MPQNPKLFVHGTLIDVCFRIEEGLPLVCAPYMQTILTSYMATAQTLYPVEICHFLFMGNHVHILLVVDDPQNVPRFVCYFKRETAFAINKLMGRKRGHVWKENYDSPVVLDANKAIERIVYIYTNPQQADLVDEIEQYPNLNSWNALLLAGNQTINCKHIPRREITYLKKGYISLKEQQELADLLISLGKEESALIITPHAWLKCFRETANSNPENIRDLVIEKVRQRENYLRSIRKYGVVGAHSLRLQLIAKPHTPKKFCKRMICLASISTTRKVFIRWFRSCCAQVNSKIHQYPAGMFAPGCFLFSNVIPFAVPIVCEAILVKN